MIKSYKTYSSETKFHRISGNEYKIHKKNGRTIFLRLHSTMIEQIGKLKNVESGTGIQTEISIRPSGLGEIVTFHDRLVIGSNVVIESGDLPLSLQLFRGLKGTIVEHVPDEHKRMCYMVYIDPDQIESLRMDSDVEIWNQFTDPSLTTLEYGIAMPLKNSLVVSLDLSADIALKVFTRTNMGTSSRTSMVLDVDDVDINPRGNDKKAMEDGNTMNSDLLRYKGVHDCIKINENNPLHDQENLQRLKLLIPWGKYQGTKILRCLQLMKKHPQLTAEKAIKCVDDPDQRRDVEKETDELYKYLLEEDIIGGAPPWDGLFCTKSRPVDHMKQAFEPYSNEFDDLVNRYVIPL